MLETRPYLILNSTNGTATISSTANESELDLDSVDRVVTETSGFDEDECERNRVRTFGCPFTFTRRDFESIDSDINDYSLARAVMATATFPAVFNYMTLKNFQLSDPPGCKKDCDRFVHVFDGGNADNLGLKSVSHLLKTLPCNDENYDRLVVILVDSFTGNSGISNKKSDPRSGFDFVVDTNFLEATDSLLSANRKEKIEAFKKNFISTCSTPSKSIFYHIKFEDVKSEKLKNNLNRIKTDFRISDEDAGYIDTAINDLITPQNTCLIGIKNLLVNGNHSADQICTY